jgi:hypothetical protein
MLNTKAKGKQMKTLRSYDLQSSRRTDAQRMANEMVEMAKAKAVAKFGCADPEAFALGYLNSLLAQVASASPAAMRELESALGFAKENQ